MTKKSSRDQSTSSVQNISKAGIPSSRGSDKTHNNNLYICALLTYGCLFRPHHEIRLLRWGDFSDDLSYITLSGSRVKSKVIVLFLCLNMYVKSLLLGIKTTTYFRGILSLITEANLMGFGNVLRYLILSLTKTLHYTHLDTQGR